MKKNATGDNLIELFKFQDISSETYSQLDDIAENYMEIGIRVALSMAFFCGYLTGKREERLKKNTHV